MSRKNDDRGSVGVLTNKFKKPPSLADLGRHTTPIRGQCKIADDQVVFTLTNYRFGFGAIGNDVNRS